MRPLILLFSCFLTFLSSVNAQEVNQITYIANEGVLIEYGGKKVLIDALHDKYHDLYHFTRSNYVHDMMNGLAAYDSIPLMLVTHVHGDHFDAAYTEQFLRAHGETKLIAPGQVLDSLTNIIGLENQFYPVDTLDTGVVYEMDGLSLQAFPLLHSYQKRNHWVENMAYLLDFNGWRILHIGDAELHPENYRRIKIAVGEGIDYALLPDWYFHDENTIQSVNDNIPAKKYVAIHVARTESGLYEQRLKKRMKPFGLQLSVFSRIGETEKIER